MDSYYETHIRSWSVPKRSAPKRSDTPLREKQSDQKGRLCGRRLRRLCGCSPSLFSYTQYIYVRSSRDSRPKPILPI